LIPRISSDKEIKIAALIEQSHTALREAKTYLEKAKHAVETAIVEGEENVMAFNL
jgi:hypothetical protein